MPTSEALSLEQRGAPRRQVPADPQQAGSRPPVQTGVARHASRLRRAGRVSTVSCSRVPPWPHSPAHYRRLSLGLTRPLHHQPLRGGLLRSFCSILRAPAPPGPQFLLLCAPSALHTLEPRDPCLAVSPKGPALLAPTDPGSSWGVGISARKRQTRTTGAEADGRSLPLGPCPTRSRQAGAGRRGWADGGGAAVLKKGPEEAA